MDSIYNFIGITISLFLIYLGLKEYNGIKKERIKISLKIDDNSIKTDDLSISAMSSVNFFINFGEEFDFCKFYFIENEIFVYFRYCFPKEVYSGPFVLKKNNLKNENRYTYMNTLYIKRILLKESNNEFNIVVRNKFLFLGSRYSFHFKGVSENDFELIKKFMT